MTDTPKPDTLSEDYVAMQPHWDKVNAVMGGIESMREANSTYLPKHPDENEARYKFRCETTKLTNIYQDVVENLALRPFANPVTLKEGTFDSVLEAISKNVDNRGTDMHTFAQETFRDGIHNAIDWIVVDYPKKKTDRALSLAEEEALNLRPYWRHYSATDVIAVFSAFQDNGEEVITHMRLRETKTKIVNFKEVKVKRIREFNRQKVEDGSGVFGPASVTVWEYQKKERSDEMEWVIVEPERVLSIDIIPAVPFITGARIKKSGWCFRPPMKSALDLQIEHYQQESGLKNIKTLAAYPMLSGDGVEPDVDENDKPKSLDVGPMSVLYAPEGSWRMIEPSATSMKFLAEDNKDTARELRELGRQPLTAQSGNLTVITTSFAAQKGNSAIQNWALALRYTLERAWEITCLWLKKEATVEVNVSMNFDHSYGEDKSFSDVIKLGEGENPVISRKWVVHEGKRRNVLDPDYDEEEDLDELLRQDTGAEEEEEDPPEDQDDENQEEEDDDPEEESDDS